MERLDSDEFGPMVGADYFQQGNAELETLKRREQELLEQKQNAEAEFGQQRAKFMELFKQKEDDLRLTREQLTAAQRNCSEQADQLSKQNENLKKLQVEINDIKTAGTISDFKRTDEMEKVARKYREELASLQSIIKELTENQSEETLAVKYEQDIKKLTRQRERLEAELQETRKKQNKDGILTSFTKTIQKRVSNVDLRDLREADEENLEDSLKMAQEDAERLKMILTPFEEEISSLKAELKHCKEHLALLESEELNSIIEIPKRRHSYHDQCHTSILDCTDGGDVPTECSKLSPSPVICSSRHEDSRKDSIRFVSRQEWKALQKEVALARENAGKYTCQLCIQKEMEIKSLQEEVKRSQEQVIATQRHLENEKQTRIQLENYKERLETSLNTSVADTRAQLSIQMSKLQDSEKFLLATKRKFSEEKQALQEQMNVMTSYREELQTELTRLQEENDDLVGKHSKSAQEIQEEFINLPNSIEEIQLLVLKCREETIKSKVSKEHTEQVLRKELEYARVQLQQQNTKERDLSQEINQLREELAIRNSLYSDLEQRLVGLDKQLVDENKKLEPDLQKELNDVKTAKNNLERTLHQRNAKVESLKTDLANMEAVQKDFVMYSQSLQIELDKMRLTENQVRWQFEEDVDTCGNCQKSFDSTSSKKLHCMHCGHIFCNDCLHQTISTGSNINRRPAEVCQSCHDILTKDPNEENCKPRLQLPQVHR